MRTSLDATRSGLVSEISALVRGDRLLDGLRGDGGDRGDRIAFIVTIHRAKQLHDK